MNHSTAQGVTEVLRRHGWPYALALPDYDGRDIANVSGVAIRVGNALTDEQVAWLAAATDDGELDVLVSRDTPESSDPQRWACLLRLVDGVRLIRALHALQAVAEALADRDDTEAITRYVTAVLGDLEPAT